jgi:RNA polymerase sigma factor (sigma-70 family)
MSMEEKLMMSVERFVALQADKFSHTIPYMRDDFYQEGMIAAYKAALNWDDTRDNNFLSYAGKCIIGKMTNFFRHFYSQVPAKERAHDKFSMEARALLESTAKERNEYCEKKKCKLKDLEDFLCTWGHAKQVRNTTEGEELAIDIPSFTDFEEDILKNDLIKIVKNNLTNEQQNIILYMMTDPSPSYVAYGKRKGVSGEAIRSNYKCAIKKLRKCV